MPLFTAIGTAIGFGAATAAAGGLTAFGAGAVVAGIGTAAIGSTAYSMSQSGKQKTSAPVLPQSPSIASAEAQAKDATRARLKAASRSQSIFTSPLGISGEAEIAQKTLLGQ